MFSSGHQVILPTGVSSFMSKIAAFPINSKGPVDRAYGYLHRPKRRLHSRRIAPAASSQTDVRVHAERNANTTADAAFMPAVDLLHKCSTVTSPNVVSNATYSAEGPACNKNGYADPVATLLHRISRTYIDAVTTVLNGSLANSTSFECRMLRRTLSQLFVHLDASCDTTFLDDKKRATPIASTKSHQAVLTADVPPALSSHVQSISSSLNSLLRRRQQHCRPPMQQGKSFHDTAYALGLSSASTLLVEMQSTLFQRRGLKTRAGGRLQSTSLREQAAEGNLLQRFVSKYMGKPAGKRSETDAAPVLDDSVRDKYLKGDPRLTEDEQNRVKLAFLEGFVNAKSGNISTTAGDTNSSSGSKTLAQGVRSFALFLLTLGIILVMLTLLSNVASMRQLIGMSQHEIMAENVDVSFDDVRGCDEAKDELREIVEYLKNPERFSALGGRLPKGVLLIGPPGTGKTLLGRAVAGEAGVPFFHVAGSEFDEILVGQGARRVRDLFTSAKEKAPCVIFIDEIDAVGSKRTSSVIHPHANQTINQLLAEMDGFHQNEGVIVLGASNRRDDLDKALTRPGRFDIEVHVPIPDLKGRTDIINYYLAKIRIAPDVSAEVLARGTTGFTGADLESMINQSALKGASDGCTEVNMEYLEHARDKVLMGPAKKFRIPDEDANKMTAFHEAGHTLVAYFTEHAMPLHKVTIIPRGMSLGHTAYIPEKENYQTSRAQMLAMLDTLIGGRAAEELIFGEKGVTSGAADDLRKASDMVRQMVKHFGMSERVGLRFFHSENEEGGVLIAQPDMSPATQDIIDQEIRRILHESYERAKGLLVKHAKEHKALAEALLLHETLDASQIKIIVEGRGANMPKMKRLL